MERLLKRFVCCESPTTDKKCVDRFSRILAAEWRKRRAEVQVLRRKGAGDHLRVTWPAQATRRNRGVSRRSQVLVLGHMDTVYAAGTIRSMPFRVSKGRSFGPGVFDMKSGLVIALLAVDALAYFGWLPRRRITFLWTSDEETGSKSSQEVIEREARKSAAVLVLEPANGPGGQLKTRRKATGTAELVITGRAAHAGLNPEQGVNAIHELALQAERLIGWTDPRRGITVSPTIAQGGQRSNVIPAEARLTVDLRAENRPDMQEIERKLKALRPILPGASLKVCGGFSRPPLEGKHSAALFSRAKELSKELGFTVVECMAGGGSDGNFTAALGIPTLDGLGAIGKDAHSPNEQVVLASLPQRAALLAALIRAI